MAKPFKIFLWVVGTFIALLVTVAIAVPLFFDPNEHRDRIARAAEDNTGRQLSINGDIDLSVFPWLSVQVNDVVMGNAAGFGPEPFAQVAQLDAGVRLLPLLLDRQVQIGEVTIKGLQLNLAKGQDGGNNWSDIGAAEEAPDTPAETPAGEPIAFTVGGLNIEDASLKYTDQQSGATHKIEKLNLKTGPVELGKPLDLTLSLVATTGDMAADITLALTALADFEQKTYEARDLKLEVIASGAGVPAGKQEIRAHGTARFDQATGALSLPDLVIDAAGVVLNAALAGQNLTGDAPKLSGKLSTNTFSPREVLRKLAITLAPTADESALSQASFAADYSGDFSSARLAGLTLKLDRSTVTGLVNIRDFATQAIEFALKADALDADRYLPPSAKTEGAAAAPGQGDFRQTPIPAELLDAVNAKGTVELASLTFKGVKLNDVKLALDAPKGKVKTQNLTAQLYGGRIQQSARITPAARAGAQPTYDIKAGLQDVNTNPLLTDLVGKAYLSGAGNFNLAFTGSGLTVGDLLKGLDGSLSTSLLDGALEGFNLKHTIAQARALAKGQPAAAANAPKRTEFSDLAASARIDDGVLTTRALKASGNDYNLTGDGNINLVAQEINYVLKPTYTGGSEKGLTVPVSITGSLFDPKVRVDFKGFVKEQATQELKKQEDRLKEKVNDKLQDFLRKRAPEQKTPPPAPQPPAEPAPSESQSPEAASPPPASPSPDAAPPESQSPDAEPAPAEQPPAS